MRKQIIEQAAFEVATQVRAVEDTIDSALAEIAELQSRMVRARSSTGIGVVHSHPAFTRLAGALQGLISARGEMGSCHAALLDAKGQVPGLRTVAFGDGYDCPEEGSATRQLRIVA